VRHIGIQHDGYLSPDTVEAKMYDDKSVDTNSEIPKYPRQLISERDNQVMTGPNGLQPREPVTFLNIFSLVVT
jgi:hypothetical protein